jgi:cytoskeletal protein CcmA (bactofilin family)
MFRRKEDSLFDNATDSGNEMDVQESATVVSPSTSSAAQPSSPPAYLSNQPQSQMPRAPEPRPAAQPASSFRPATPPAPAATNDLARSRMPEPKPASPTPPSPASAFSVSGSKPVKRVLTVGNDILLKGEIATCDRLVIEGKVDATLNDVHTVEIAETGSFKGAAHIEDAEISGLFEGDLIVRNRLVIYATGKVRGKITYGEIEIERGGELTGEIKTSNPGSQTSSARPARQPKEDKVAA